MADRTKIVRVVVDDDFIAAAHDVMTVIDPVWWLANFYEDHGNYEASLAQFSRLQRFVWAMLWYNAEICNGGHSQFYSNSTGMVWQDALLGFEVVPICEAYDILSESVRRLGGSPSLDRDERNEQLDDMKPNFDDLDDRYYALIKEQSLEDTLLAFVKRRPRDFNFYGDVPVPTDINGR